MVFPVVMYGCESWTVKKAEHWRIDAFELWCWRRLLRAPWTARRSNQSILKDISPEYSLEGLMLKLKLQHFGHLMRRADSFEKTLMLGKIEAGRRRGWQRMRWTTNMTLSKLQVLVMDREAWCAALHGVAKNQTWLSNWTELNWRDLWDNIKCTNIHIIGVLGEDERERKDLRKHLKRYLRRKFTAIQSYLGKQEKCQINHLTWHLKQLEKEKQTKSNVSRRKEIINTRSEINEIN